MAAYKSNSRLNAEQYLQQSQDATNRIANQSGGWKRWLTGPSDQQRLDARRAMAQEDYAMQQAWDAQQREAMLPTAVGGADALARMAGARPQDLTDSQRIGYGYNLAQQAQAGIDPNTTAGVAGANPMLNPAVAQEIQNKIGQQDFSNQLALAKEQRLAGAQASGDVKTQLEIANQEALLEGRKLANLGAQRAYDLGNLPFNDAVELQTKLDVFGGASEGFQTLQALIGSFPNAAALANNPDAMGTAKAQTMRILPAMAQLANSGTLNEGEREFYDDLLNDPESVITRIASNDRKTIATYNGFIRQLDQRRESLVKMADRYGAGRAIDRSVATSPFQLPEGAGEVVQPKGAADQTKSAMEKVGTGLPVAPPLMGY